MNIVLKSNNSVLNSDERFLTTPENASSSRSLLDSSSSSNVKLSPITVGVHKTIFDPLLLISAIIFLKPFS